MTGYLEERRLAVGGVTPASAEARDPFRRERSRSYLTSARVAQWQPEILKTMGRTLTDTRVAKAGR